MPTKELAYSDRPKIREFGRKRLTGELFTVRDLHPGGRSWEHRQTLSVVMDDGRVGFIRFARDGSTDTDAQRMRDLAATLIEEAEYLER